MEDHLHGSISLIGVAADTFLPILDKLGLGGGATTSRPFPLREARFAAL